MPSAEEENTSIRQNELLYNDERIESKDYYVEISPRLPTADGIALTMSQASQSRRKNRKKSGSTGSAEQENSGHAESQLPQGTADEEIDVEFWRSLLKSYGNEGMVSILQGEDNPSHRQQQHMQQQLHEQKQQLHKGHEQSNTDRQDSSKDKSHTSAGDRKATASPSAAAAAAAATTTTTIITEQSSHSTDNDNNSNEKHISHPPNNFPGSTSDHRFLPMFQEADEDADMNKVRQNLALMIRQSQIEDPSDERDDDNDDNNSMDAETPRNVSQDLKEVGRDADEYSSDTSVLSDWSTEHSERPPSVPPLHVDKLESASRVDKDEHEDSSNEISDVERLKRDLRRIQLEAEKLETPPTSARERDGSYSDHFRRLLMEKNKSTELQSPRSRTTHDESHSSRSDGSPRQGVTTPSKNHHDSLDSPGREMLQRYVEHVQQQQQQHQQQQQKYQQYQQLHHHEHTQPREPSPRRNVAARFANRNEDRDDPEKKRLRYLVAKLQVEYRQSKRREQKAMDTAFIFSNLLHHQQKYTQSLHGKCAQKDIEISELRSMVDDLNNALRRSNFLLQQSKMTKSRQTAAADASPSPRESQQLTPTKS